MTWASDSMPNWFGTGEEQRVGAGDGLVRLGSC